MTGTHGSLIVTAPAVRVDNGQLVAGGGPVQLQNQGGKPIFVDAQEQQVGQVSVDYRLTLQPGQGFKLPANAPGHMWHVVSIGQKVLAHTAADVGLVGIGLFALAGYGLGHAIGEGYEWLKRNRGRY